MSHTERVTAAFIIIGNEILSGRTQDANLSFLAQHLGEIGIQVAEARVIPDIEQTIVDTVLELSAKVDYVFTSGGIGPTHDDITAQSVAKAFGLKYELHKEGYKILEAYYQPGEFNEGRQKMIWMPENADLILNPTSGAPGFSVENVFCLPGVPSIMKSTQPVELNRKSFCMLMWLIMEKTFTHGTTDYNLARRALVRILLPWEV